MASARYSAVSVLLKFEELTLGDPIRYESTIMTSLWGILLICIISCTTALETESIGIEFTVGNVYSYSHRFSQFTGDETLDYPFNHKQQPTSAISSVVIILLNSFFISTICLFIFVTPDLSLLQRKVSHNSPCRSILTSFLAV